LGSPYSQENPSENKYFSAMALAPAIKIEIGILKNEDK
jgi:hypothetical protein